MIVKLSRDYKHERHNSQVIKVHAGVLLWAKEGGSFKPCCEDRYSWNMEGQLFFMRASIILDVTYFRLHLLLRHFSCSMPRKILWPRSRRSEYFTRHWQLENNSMSTWCRQGPPRNFDHFPKGPLGFLSILYRQFCPKWSQAMMK